MLKKRFTARMNLTSILKQLLNQDINYVENY